MVQTMRQIPYKINNSIKEAKTIHQLHSPPREKSKTVVISPLGTTEMIGGENRS